MKTTEATQAPKSAELNAPVKPEEFRAMAESLNKIQTAARGMATSGLTTEAIVILLQHRTKISFRDIREILDELQNLGSRYLTPEYLKRANSGK